MALQRGVSVAGMVISAIVIAMVVAYGTGIIADAEKDIKINETESPEAATAVEKMFSGTYTGIGTSGTIIKLSFVGVLIAVIVGFGYSFYRARD